MLLSLCSAIPLLCNTFATVFGSYVLIEVLGPTSGAHVYPAASLVMAWRAELQGSPVTKVSALVAAYLGAALGFATFEWLKKR
jgi:glycerol uptake facilitator-like aquaporin